MSAGVRRCHRPGCRKRPKPGRRFCSPACCAATPAALRRTPDPTPRQLAARVAAIRAGWTERQERQRLARRPPDLTVPCCRVLGDVPLPDEDRLW